MRYMLYECNEKTVPLEKEIDYIRNYLELERLRHGDKASIHFDIIGDPEGYSISPLLFTPFLENSFKHGLNNSIDSKFVEVTLKIEQKGILFEIKNSKPLAPVLKEHGGIGLANIYRRLDILYPNNYELVIKEEATTYNVYLKIQPILYQSSTNKIKEYEQN
jgi:LytS/YehU family sensor histidine kinase